MEELYFSSTKSTFKNDSKPPKTNSKDFSPCEKYKCETKETCESCLIWARFLEQTAKQEKKQRW